MNNGEQISDSINQMAAKENKSMMNEGSNSMDDERRRDRARLKRLRRKAAPHNLTIQKSKQRDPRAIDYGGYWLVEEQAPGGGWRSRMEVAGGTFGLSLDELERALDE